MTFDTVTPMKEQDPTSWRCALSEYEYQKESEGTIMSFHSGLTYYWTIMIHDRIFQPRPAILDFCSKFGSEEHFQSNYHCLI